MALVTAASEFDNTAVDFDAEFHPANTYLFQNNVDYTSPQGRVYEDVLRINWYDELDFQARWGGTGLAFNPTTKAFTAGTLTGLVAGTISGSTFTQELAVEGISYSAVAFHTIATSASLADDMNFIRAIFAGSDTFNLSPQADRADGFAGNDTLRGYGGNDTLQGNTGNDWLDGGLGIDRLVGGTGNDMLVANVAADVVVELSGGGTDTVRSAVGRTLGAYQEHLTLTGSLAINGTGNTLPNAITGNAGTNRLTGGAGDDTLNGAGGVDTLVGGTGNDTFLVDAADVITEVAAGGIDTVRSGSTRALGVNQENLLLTGSAAINGNGNAAPNTITCNTGANALTGNGGNDRVNGGAGNDLLNGGAGLDTLSGGAGLDAFRFNTAPSTAANAERVLDFVSADDRLQFENAVFTALGAAGALPAAAFRLGAAAADASDRIVYNSATGQLYYDADGNGAVAAILVATFNPGTSITLADLWVI